MLKVLLSGYATGVFSARKLSKRCAEDVAFIYLAGKQRPDFRTIIGFRARHIAIPLIEQIKETFGEYPESVLADGGYPSEENFKALDTLKINGLVACGREVYDPSLRAPRGPIPKGATFTDRMKRKLLTKAGRALYRTRKHVAEPVIAWIKSVLGFRQFSLGGISKVRGEWNLVCLALNLRRLRALAT